MSNIGLEIFIIFLLLIANGLFSMSEIALVTARKSRLQELADKNSARARAALDLANKPNQFPVHSADRDYASGNFGRCFRRRRLD